MKYFFSTLLFLYIGVPVLSSIVEKHGTGLKTSKGKQFVTSNIEYPGSKYELDNIMKSLKKTYKRILKQTKGQAPNPRILDENMREEDDKESRPLLEIDDQNNYSSSDNGSKQEDRSEDDKDKDVTDTKEQILKSDKKEQYDKGDDNEIEQSQALEDIGYEEETKENVANNLIDKEEEEEKIHEKDAKDSTVQVDIGDSNNKQNAQEENKQDLEIPPSTKTGQEVDIKATESSNNSTNKSTENEGADGKYQKEDKNKGQNKAENEKDSNFEGSLEANNSDINASTLNEVLYPEQDVEKASSEIGESKLNQDDKKTKNIPENTTSKEKEINDSEHVIDFKPITDLFTPVDQVKPRPRSSPLDQPDEKEQAESQPIPPLVPKSPDSSSPKVDEAGKASNDKDKEKDPPVDQKKNEPSKGWCLFSLFKNETMIKLSLLIVIIFLK